MDNAASTIIRRGKLLDVAARRLEAADVLVVNGRIEAIGPPGMPAPADAQPVDADDRMLIPGLVNGHTHSHGALGKGFVDERSTLELFLTLAPALGRAYSLEDKYLSAKLSACEMVRKGCTTCLDMFGEFPLPSVEGVRAVASAYEEVGMRAVIAPMMADRSLYAALPGLLEALPDDLRAQVSKIQAAPYEASLAACREMLESWSFDRDRIRPALAPTVPMHCSDDFLRGCDRLAREHGIALQTHLAESKSQALRGQERYGKTLTAHLDELGMLGTHLSAAHGVWLDEDDLKRLADHGASVIHNPLSNLRLGSGLAPVRQMLARGLNVGLGSDAANTSDTQNMFEVTRIASYLSRIQLPDHEQWLGCDEVFNAATRGNARALGFGDRIGRIETGAAADLVFLRLDHIDYWPLRDPLLQMVHSESGAAVDSVMIDGHMVLEHGRFTTVDEAALRRDVERAVERIDRDAAGGVAFAASVRRYVGAFCVANHCTHYHAERRADICSGPHQ
jgi:5-methylthioadenosine/S-adenosylhomocysteine deaminase